MTITIPKWSPLLAALTVAAFAAGWVVGGASITGWWTEVTAAWMQAVGSMAAIVGSAWVAGSQSREALRREQRDRTAAKEERDRRKIEILDVHAAAAQNLFNGLDTALGQARMAAAKGADIRAPIRQSIIWLLEDYDRLPLADVGDHYSAMRLFNMRHHARALMGALGVAMEEPTAQPDFAAAQDVIGRARGTLDELMARFQTLART